MAIPKRVRRGVLMLRVSDDEREMAEGLAERQGLSLSDAVRQAIRRDAERLGVVPAWKRRARKA